MSTFALAGVPKCGGNRRAMEKDMRGRSAEGDKEGPDGFSYSVGEAARLAGVSPSTVRLYEKQGLLELRRTPGGHRYLTEEDLNLLKRIRVLRRTQALNLGGIRRELRLAGLHSQQQAVEPPNPANRAGARIRALRLKRGLTLREVAERTGLSPSFLSSFERGLTGISVAHLQQLISVCGSSLIDIFAQPDQEQRKLVRPPDRPRLALNNGALVVEDLAVVPRQIEVQLWTIQPGAGSEGAYSHQGEEAVYLMSGSLEIQLNEAESYTMEPGDCLYFSSSEPHRWHNTGSRPAVVLWVNTPPTF